MKRQILATSMLCLLFSIMCFAQKTTEEETTLPDEVMRQIIERVLTYQFKPRRSATTIPLAESQVKKEWLPKITNITFELVSDEETIDYANGVFLFEKIEQEGDFHSINVGWGDLDCFASGNTWKFRIIGERLRLWPTRDGWGRGCVNKLPLIRGLTLGTISPNELPGLMFFKTGKVKDLRIGISDRNDVIRLFGNDCQSTCQYDEDWDMRAEYVTEGLAWTTENSDEHKRAYSAKDQFIGKLSTVTFWPKGDVPSNSFIFPNRAFVTANSRSIGHNIGENGLRGAVHTSYKTYSDGYGLEYSVFIEETFINIKNQTELKKKRRKGDLVRVEYSIPEELKDLVYNSQSVENVTASDNP